ncbi:MAG: glycosyltransferase family 2 protein [Bacteroides sp.]|nr:glycosyltransferase family 2 protein [Bacteroides sp.]
MFSLLQSIDLILFVLISISIGYLLIFTISARCARKRIYPPTATRHRFLVIFPAYQEDRVIVEAVTDFLRQDYPKDKYDIVVVSDQMHPSTNEQLLRLPLQLLIASYENSSKAKALALAIDSTEEQAYDMVVIMDADNQATPGFLEELNRAYASGQRAIQAHRKARNLNTDTAVLDAMSEEINNSIFRLGHNALHLSAALSGSGMAIDARWFREHVKKLETAGEDKELEALLLKQHIFIDYLNHVPVYDEKVQKKENFKHQRKRWIAAQFDALTNALPDLPAALRSGNWDYCNKILQWMLLPRSVLLAALGFLTLLVTPLSPWASIKWWGLCLALFLILVVNIPRDLWNRQLLKAVLHLPSLILIMVGNMFRIGKGVNKKFIHTEHGE